MKRHFLISALAVAALLAAFWSLAAPWAAAFPITPDHYKVTLFGVRHISDMTPNATQTACRWKQRLDACATAIDGEDHFVKAARARWFVLAGIAIMILGVLALRMRTVGIWTAAPFVIAALSIGAAITLMRSNIGSALAAFSAAKVTVGGTGMFAAEIAAGVCFIAGLVAAIPASHKHTSLGSSPS